MRARIFQLIEFVLVCTFVAISFGQSIRSATLSLFG